MRRFVLSLLLAFSPLVHSDTYIEDNPIIINGVSHEPREIQNPEIIYLVHRTQEWISHYTELNTDVEMPRLRYASRAYIEAIFRATTGLTANPKRVITSLTMWREIEGIEARRLTFFLDEDFNANDIENQSRVAHEMMHVIQYHNNVDKRLTRGCLEEKAYAIQAQWLTEFGFSAEHEKDRADYQARAILWGNSCQNISSNVER